MNTFERITAVAGVIAISSLALVYGTAALTRPKSILTQEDLKSPEAYKDAWERAGIPAKPSTDSAPATLAADAADTVTTADAMPPLPRPRPNYISAPSSVAVAPLSTNFTQTSVAVQTVYQPPVQVVQAKPDAAVLLDRFSQISRILNDVDPSVPWLQVFGRVRTSAQGGNPSHGPAEAACMMSRFADLVRGSAYFESYIPQGLQRDMNVLINGVESLPRAVSCRL